MTTVRVQAVQFIVLTVTVAITSSCGRDDTTVGVDRHTLGCAQDPQDRASSESIATLAVPSLGWLQHRGQRHALRDLAESTSRAQVDDDWARAFPFESAIAVNMAHAELGCPDVNSLPVMSETFVPLDSAAGVLMWSAD